MAFYKVDDEKNQNENKMPPFWLNDPVYRKHIHKKIHTYYCTTVNYPLLYIHVSIYLTSNYYHPKGRRNTILTMILDKKKKPLSKITFLYILVKNHLKP